MENLRRLHELTFDDFQKGFFFVSEIFVCLYLRSKNEIN